MITKIKNSLKKEKQIFTNIIGAFLIKGASMILALFTMPAYMRYFQDNTVLGVWFTILSFLNWVMMFDLGIGNGLRNKLPLALEKKDDKIAKEYITSSYFSISLIAIVLCAVFLLIQPLLDWNSILNVSSTVISKDVLQTSVTIVIIGILIRFAFNLSTSIFYALQKSVVNNFLAFLSSFLILMYVVLAPVGTVESNLINLSYAHVIISNLPLLIATIFLFCKPLKGLAPNIKYFNLKKAKEILKIGTVLLWLQIAAMIVLSTHSILITKLRNPAEVVEYNIYYKIFNTIASIFALALTPIWSAVTKAQAQKRYHWIDKVYSILLIMPVVVLVLGFITIPFLQFVFDIWLKEESILVNVQTVIIMAFFSMIFVLHNVNTSVNNGMSFFKVQNIWMGIAAVLMIPLSYLFCQWMDSWTGVILACCVAILPYELLQPILTKKRLKQLMH